MEMIKTHKNTLIIATVLGLIMLATRFQHFGSPVHLPDASMAVFFLAGFYLRRLSLFAIFLALAGLADYVSIAGGVSGWCVTPGYFFLVPAYGALWLAGLWLVRHYQRSWNGLGMLVAAVFLGTVLAFLISNAGFYFYSGYFANLTIAGYVERVTQYFWPYLFTVFAYIGMATVLHFALTAKGRTTKIPG